MTESIRVGDLPKELTEGVVRELSAFSIGFARVVETANRPRVDLLGSGTLVTAGRKQAILTAHHVVQVLPRVGRLGLLLWSSDHPTTVDCAGLGFLEIARGVDDSVGPDLGAVVLSAPIASAIAAQKSFYNLDNRRDGVLNRPPQDNEGFWIANGFIDERTTEHRGEGIVSKRFFNLSAAGGAERQPDVDQFDYYQYPVSIEGREYSPRSFGGMSGGGLWQIPLAREGNGSVVSRTPLFSGLVFYQVPTTSSECGVRCHGRRSIYEIAYEAIRGAL